MLSLRILTAIALIVPTILSLFFLSSAWVTAYFGLFIAAGAWEWTALVGIRHRLARATYAATVLSVGVLSILGGPQVMNAVCFLALIFWTAVLIELVRRPQVGEGWLHRPAVSRVVGVAILAPPLVAIYALHANDAFSPWLLVFAFVLVWVADSAAYFAGHFFGRTKLAPTISPGKTVEGVIGGLIGVALLAWIFSALIWRHQGASLAGWFIVAVIAAAFSVLGDLLESKFKRAAGVKDSGNTLPGHGGVLDRIDAATAALPVFALGWLFFGGL
jgi:phosphatidate cytidylyltransferase